MIGSKGEVARAQRGSAGASDLEGQRRSLQGMFKRHLSGPLLASAATFPLITLTGPRQSGKTTLARSLFPGHTYVTLEASDERDHAIEDPRGFLARFSGPVILDEVQRTPDLFSYIQGVVDDCQTPAQFVLSGSQNFLLLKKVSQTLAGRCAVHHLLPLSLAELHGWPLRPDLTEGTSVTQRDPPSPGLIPTLLQEFYPVIHDRGHDPQTWLASYYQTYVERDVRELVSIRDLETFHRFVRLCAGRNGQILDVSGLAADCGVARTTVTRWLSVLEASFIIFMLRPHHGNFGKRLVKRPKLYFLDTGLLCYLLGIRGADELQVHASRGAVFEAYVLAELVKSALHSGRAADVWFWRSSDGHEVDFILEAANKLTAVEAKSGQTVGSDFFSGLRYWRDQAGERCGQTTLVHGGTESYTRNESILLPWFGV